MTKPEFRMYTDTHKEVTQLIEDGKTEAFTDRKRAEKKAKERKTYVYELYARTVLGNRFWGYGVPLK